LGSGAARFLPGGTGTTVRDDHDRPQDPEVCRTTREDTPLTDALAGPPSRSGRSLWPSPDPHRHIHLLRLSALCYAPFSRTV